MREDDMVVVSRKSDGTPDVWCDPDIADIVAALNRSGIRTIASCGGHGRRPGRISLQDGREIVLPRDGADLAVIEAAFPLTINGDGRLVTDALGAAGYYIDRLRTAHSGKPVRDLDEAGEAYYRLAGLARAALHTEGEKKL